MQLMDCATLATATLSAWRWKMSSVMPVSRASRMVDWLGEVVLGREFGALAVPCAPLIDYELDGRPDLRLFAWRASGR